MVTGFTVESLVNLLESTIGLALLIVVESGFAAFLKVSERSFFFWRNDGFAAALFNVSLGCLMVEESVWASVSTKRKQRNNMKNIFFKG